MPGAPTAATQPGREVRRLATGRSNRRLASVLDASPRTAAPQVANLSRKVGQHSEAEATASALRHDLA